MSSDHNLCIAESIDHSSVASPRLSELKYLIFSPTKEIKMRGEIFTEAEEARLSHPHLSARE